MYTLEICKFLCVFPFYCYCYLFIATYFFVNVFCFCLSQHCEQPEGLNFATITSDWQKWNGGRASIFPFLIQKWIKKIKILPRKKCFQNDFGVYFPFIDIAIYSLLFIYLLVFFIFAFPNSMSSLKVSILLPSSVNGKSEMVNWYQYFHFLFTNG